MTNRIRPAIVVVAYNRIESVVRLMRRISESYYDDKDIPLIVSIDHSEKENEVIEVVKKIGWKYGKLEIRIFDERQGLKNHVIACGDLAEKYGAVIVLEDDLYLSKNYYSYIEQMLNAFKNDNRICGISLYCHSWNGYGNYQFIPQRNEYDVFIGQIGVSWGQCWTKNQWSDFKIWYEKNKDKETFNNNLPYTINEWGNQSWAKYFYNYMIEQGKYYILPYTSLSTNFSEIGEHSNEISIDYQVPIMDAKKKEYSIPEFDEAIKYDMYFERVLDGMTIAGICGEDICVNLNGFKNSLFGKKYLLTCKQIKNIKAIKSFGLRLRPIEENVINDIPGADIFMYSSSELTEMDIQNYRHTSLNRIRYEIYGNPIKRLEYYIGKNNDINNLQSIDINIWDTGNVYEIIQNKIETLIRQKTSTGSIWMFHNVDNITEWDDPEYSITPLIFEDLIKNRLKNGYKFGNINNVIDTRDDHLIYLTFDDGYKGIYEYVMPICKKYNIPFCVFISVNFVGQPMYMNDNEIRSLSECGLCTVGSHSFSHPKMRFLSTEEKKRELIYSKYIIEGIIKREIQLFAYPYGSVYAVDKESIVLAKETGYNMAFSTICSHNSSIEDMRYFLPRININEKEAVNIINNNLMY